MFYKFKYGLRHQNNQFYYNSKDYQQNKKAKELRKLANAIFPDASAL